MNSALISPGEWAPDFQMIDISGNAISLSMYRRTQPVVLAFLRGFR